METICYPFFFASRGDAAKWEPKDPVHVMQNLRWYDWFRQQVLQSHDLPANSTLTRDQFHDCWTSYLKWFIAYELGEDQVRGNATNYMASRMHKDTGNRFAVYAAWTFGVPTISEDLWEKCHQAAMLQTALADEDRQTLRSHIEICINWLQVVADDVQQRKATDKYQDEKRKSGRHKQTGLNATELRNRELQHQSHNARRHGWR